MDVLASQILNPESRITRPPEIEYFEGFIFQSVDEINKEYSHL